MNAHNPLPTKAYRRFQSICTQTPNAVAVVDEGHSVTYQQLHTRVLERCEELTRQGLADHPYVPLMASRCMAYLVTVLACCKLGIAYVCIEPGTPGKRLIALLHVLLKCPPVRTTAVFRERSPIACPCCGAAMKIVQTRLRRPPCKRS